MSKIAILGNGFLGQRLAGVLPNSEILSVDATDRDALLTSLVDCRCDIVINTAAKTGRPNVDWCESHRAETAHANVVGALAVADVCDHLGLYLFHLGSACVFFGASPSAGGWRESDYANPRSFYTRTKYASELVLEALPRVAIARVRLPIDKMPHPRNFITKLAGYRQVVDVTNSATVIDDFIVAAKAILHARAEGVFHVTNPGMLSNRQVLDLYRRFVDPAHRFELISKDELYARGLAVAERSDCEIDCTRIKDLGIRLPHIDEALEHAMRSYGAYFSDAQELLSEAS
jgi:dTDP-4-dehydrorhamnose reductase